MSTGIRGCFSVADAVPWYIVMADLQDTLILYEDMLKAGMHFGRKKTVFHPAMGPFVFMVRDGICIIDLLETQKKLVEMIAFLKEKVASGGLILFVAPTKQSRDAVRVLADSLDMPYVLDRWLGGILTNFKVINNRVKKLEELERAQVAGELAKYTKKEQLMKERELRKMQERFGGLKKLTRLPDLVFVSSVKEGKLPIAEARRVGIRVAGIVNTDADPKLVDFAVPANDRSKVSLDLIFDVLTKELAAGRVTA